MSRSTQSTRSTQSLALVQIAWTGIWSGAVVAISTVGDIGDTRAFFRDPFALRTGSTLLFELNAVVVGIVRSFRPNVYGRPGGIDLWVRALESIGHTKCAAAAVDWRLHAHKPHSLSIGRGALAEGFQGSRQLVAVVIEEKVFHGGNIDKPIWNATGETIVIASVFLGWR